MTYRAPLAQDREEPSLVEAVERVVQSGLEVVEKRIDLVQLETKSFVQRCATAGILAVVALALLVAAWIGAMGVAYLLLREPLGAAGSLGLISGVNLAAALIAGLLARRGFGRSE